MCMSDVVSVNIVHNFPKIYVKGKGTELLFISLHFNDKIVHVSYCVNYFVVTVIYENLQEMEAQKSGLLVDKAKPK
jgi:hypothetical protein